jgi:hypothetical protein
LKEGLARAAASEAARTEIYTVLADLQAQVLEATEGKIRIETKWFDQLPSLGQPREDYMKAISKSLGGAALVAHNRAVGKEKEASLAYWRVDPAGYPCRLEFPKQQYICEDKEALTIALAELLKDPGIGRKIYALMKLDEAVAGEDDIGKGQS